MQILIYMTKFMKIHLIVSECNCSFWPFLSAKSIFSIFSFSLKNVTPLLCVPTVILASELAPSLT